MTTITCKRCGTDKPEADMIVRGGKPSKLCRVCFGASFKKDGKKRGKAKCEKTLADVVEKRVRKAKVPPPVRLNGHLEVEQTYGFRAAWEDGYLAIEQDQVGDEGEAVTARLLLSKSDVARIAEWVRS